MERNKVITLFGKLFMVDYEYQPAEKTTKYHPGVDESVMEIYKIELYTMKWLSTEEADFTRFFREMDYIEEIEKLLLNP